MADLFGFSKKNAGRIVNTVQRDERRYNNGEAPRARYPSGPGSPGLRPAILTSSIAAGGTVPTSGTASVYQHFDGTTLGTGLSVKVFNPFATSWASGKFVWLTWYGGAWFIVSGDC